jgi:hypothetical protein
MRSLPLNKEKKTVIYGPPPIIVLIVFPEFKLYSSIESAIVVLEINSFVFLFHSLVDDLCKLIVTTVGFDHSFLWVGHTGRTGNDLI